MTAPVKIVFMEVPVYCFLLSDLPPSPCEFHLQFTRPSPTDGPLTGSRNRVPF